MGKILCRLAGVKVQGGFHLVEEFIESLEQGVRRLAEEAVMGALEQEVDQLLGRVSRFKSTAMVTRPAVSAMSAVWRASPAGPAAERTSAAGDRHSMGHADCVAAPGGL